MSDVSAAPAEGQAAAPAAPATDLTQGQAPAEGQAAAPEGGAQQQAPEAGQGAPAGDGQGAGDGIAPEGGASAEGEAPKGDAKEGAQGAPEAYADFAMPDGFELAGDMLDSVTSFAKAQNLTQDQAQAIVDMGVKQAQTIMAQISEQATASPVILAEHWAGEWSKQTAADPTLGGDKLKDTMALATRVFNTFATPELGKFLKETGLTHHPELIRFMHKVGQAVSEDTLVTPQGGANKPPPGRDPARKLYPGMA